MSYNDGMPHMEFYDTDEDKKEIAKEFSEGDEQLENYLFELWNNNIKTRACCRGHDDYSKKPAYISIIINDDSRPIIEESVNYMFSTGAEIECDFGHYQEDGFDEFSIYFFDEKAKNDYWNHMNQYLKQKITYETNNNIPNYANSILKFADKNSLDARFIVVRDFMLLGYTEPGMIQFFSEKAPELDGYLEEIKETGKIPLRPLKISNEESLKNYCSIIDPDIKKAEKKNIEM